MLWLPYYLKSKGYNSYETAGFSSILDIGNVLGGVLIGYLTDLTYSRRTPLAVLSILLATVMQVILIILDPNDKAPFFIFIFIFGVLMGGAVAIISGISCADLVTLFSQLTLI
jgi:sugar phosphate permease